MGHLKAAVFVTPSEANFDLIAKELKDPKFKEYHLFFSNIVPSDMLARLARLDENDLIMQVQEYYADFMAINEDFFHLGVENSLSLSSSTRTLESGQVFERNMNGVLSVLLSLKRRPSQIRYQAASEVARRMASDILTNIEKEDGLFDFGRKDGPMLLILDRRDDPVTPLLTQWTYQAMVHELLGLNNNRVILRGAPNIPKDLEEVVLSASQDAFFATNRYANFGDIAVAVKSLLDDYQKHTKKNESIQSIEDMQNFLERYPDFRAKSLTVTKHVAVISELSRLTDTCQLLDISALEQEISCASDHSAHKQELFDRLRNPKVKLADKIRLSLLFVIKYESYNEMREIKSLLASERGVTPVQLALFDGLLEYAGEARRAPGLFSSGGLMGKLNKIASTINGVENVYTQHLPVLHYVLDSIVKGKIKDSTYPALGGAGAGKPSEIIVFMIGGATFEEATKVAEFNSANPGMKVILGGSCIHNSTSFLKEISGSFAH
jgi:vacuolar protein sorting-associated protein 45